MAIRKKSKKKESPVTDPRQDGPETGDEAITSGVIFYERLRDKAVRKCPHGQFFFQQEGAELVRKLVLGAAHHLGHPMPSLSFFERAELFYMDGVLAEVRVAGEYVVGMNKGGEVVKSPWSTPEGPKFTVSGEHGIVMNSSDEDGAYVAVLNKSVGVLVRWDLSAQYGREELTAEDFTRRRFMFLTSEEVNLDLDDSTSLRIPGTPEIRRRVRYLQADSLHLALLPQIPAGAGELLVVKASDEHRMLLYIAGKARVEYELARIYALKQSCTQEQLEEFAAASGRSVEEAKVLWVRQGLSEQVAFVRDGLEAIHEMNDKVLWDAFETTHGSSLYEAVFANWIPLRSVKKEKPETILEPVIRQVTNNLKKSLGARGRGRSRRTIKEKAEVCAERERAIRNAVLKVCETAKKAKADVVAAEDLMTPPAVAKKMKRSASTLYRWLGACELDFEQIKGDCLRQVFSRR